MVLYQLKLRSNCGLTNKRSDLVKTRAQVLNAKLFFPLAVFGDIQVCVWIASKHGCSIFSSHCQCFQHILHARLGSGKTCAQSIYISSQRNIPHVYICNRRSPSVSSRMSAPAPEDLPAYHPECLHLHQKTSQRNIPHVCICTRRSPSVSSRMSASATEDLPAYHPACLHLQPKISQRIIPHVCICKRNISLQERRATQR